MLENEKSRSRLLKVFHPGEKFWWVCLWKVGNPNGGDILPSQNWPFSNSQINGKLLPTVLLAKTFSLFSVSSTPTPPPCLIEGFAVNAKGLNAPICELRFKNQIAPVFFARVWISVWPLSLSPIQPNAIWGDANFKGRDLHFIPKTKIEQTSNLTERSSENLWQIRIPSWMKHRRQ